MSASVDERHQAHMPTDVTPEVGPFDRLATKASAYAAKSWSFAACVLTCCCGSRRTCSSRASTPGS